MADSHRVAPLGVKLGKKGREGLNRAGLPNPKQGRGVRHTILKQVVPMANNRVNAMTHRNTQTGLLISSCLNTVYRRLGI